MYFKKINLSCEEKIRKFAILDIESQNIDTDKVTTQIKVNHILPLDLKNEINQELNNFGIPEVLYCLSYIRPKNHFQGIHLDGTDSTIIHSAINIPLKGSKGSYHIWYSGDYETALVKLDSNVYHRIIWKDKPIEADRLEIDSSYLVRVDAPHSAQSSMNEDRWVFTMRFKYNPAFEDLIGKL